jgi:hypothetical protein
MREARLWHAQAEPLQHFLCSSSPKHALINPQKACYNAF